MAQKKAVKQTGNILLRMHPVQRFMISLVLAAIALMLLLKTDLNGLVVSIIVWAVFALSYIITSWIVFFTRPTSGIREHARQEDGSRLYVFLLVIFSSFAGVVAVLLLILSKDPKGGPVYIIAAVSGMLFSWGMVHTIFAFHYAHLYYGNDKEDPSKHAEGLDFPDEKKPDYLDFAYFSFVIGMTFQVSDVQVTSKLLRRLVLLHGLLSFCLNTFVVALTINMIAGLGEK
jgi:uncharacterized membrane protein